MASINNPMAILLLEEIKKENPELFFSEPHSCLLIYRLLPEISKNVIIRAIISSENGLLTTDELKNHDFFINTIKENNIEKYVTGLVELHFLERIDEQNYKINKYFFETMKKILSEGLIIDKKKFHRRARGYEKYLEKGLNKFYKFIKEKILDQFDKPVQDNELNNFLVFGKFLLKDEKSKKYSMNNFSNFLEKTEDLVNIFFFKYLLYNITKKILDEKKFTFFQLLFYLATLEPGSYFTEFPKEYYDSSFDKHLEFMNQTGFLIIKTENKNYTTIKKYFCTPLIQTLFENNNISGDFALLKYGDENAYRFLYVETNMKFYAFMPQMKTKKKEKLTSIQLNLSENYSFSSIIEKESKDELINYYIKLLHLMFRIEFILPDNGIIGYITRENIYNIIKHITSSENLLQFLSDHMSLNYDDVTKVKGKSYLINESAVNQILVLENEKKSIEIIKAACFCEFYSSNQYREYLDIMQNENINIIKTKENKNDRVIVIKNFDAKRLGNKLKDIK